MKGFKEFLFRGNVVELAVAVVIGSAFANVVDKFVSSIITPLLNSFGGANTQGWGFEIKSGQANTLVNLSAIVNALIVFLMTAAVVYFLLILPMNKLQERRKAGVEDPIEPTELELLAEIRDELRARR
ncbi:large conductance mechanosensitive channel [Barrientosiimonas humi]|uniref:Large conductance mechanosensitive channel n=1 Tax=Barrientosiimonas humi TaxID=999931 RepID=A0A542XES2_9MICO|nr:large conductance mechanosensitive channel protein MscL [Barrientosiimonas humi]TQL34322.1 large conductance mechanosensitive channel [Barrientosiimonas humi]CAG7574313.1 Large-conductance mechanosensitive channel [Barrientosiimonas humi]